MYPLTVLVHAESGMGKSWLGDTAPAPRLILDAEGGSRFTPSQPKVMWNPMEGPPPQGAETVIVLVRDFAMMQTVFQWLNSGQHDFRSVVLDSVTELQKRCLDAISGVNQASQQDWGELLRQMEKLVRDFRDLTMHPVRPLESVVLITTTRMDDSGMYRPHVLGQLGLTMPYFLDVVGFLQVNQSEEGVLYRRLITQPIPGFVAKDRTNRLGAFVDNPNIEQMIAQVYGLNQQQTQEV